LFNAEKLSEEYIEGLSSPQVEVRSFFGEEPVENGRIFWGLGWGIQETQRGKALWQWGDNGPFKGFVIAYPMRKVGLVFFVNHSNGLRLVPELVRHFLQDESPAFVRLGYSMEDPPALLLGKAIMRSDFEQAIKPYIEHGASFPDTARFPAEDIMELTSHLWQRDRLEDAGKVFEAATQAYPDHAALWNGAAILALNQQHIDQAQTYYERARALDPDMFAVENLLLPWSNRSAQANARFHLAGHEDAKRVMLAGSFNDWNPESLPMVRSKAGWIAALKLPPGDYGYKLVVDGQWILDPSQSETTEEGGYTNSLLVVK
jgi:tetratricopeptide (TPR) repeat protein